MAAIARVLSTKASCYPALFVNTFQFPVVPACQSSRKHAQFNTPPARRRLLSQGPEKAAVNAAEEVRSFVQRKDISFKQYKDLCKCFSFFGICHLFFAKTRELLVCSKMRGFFYLGTRLPVLIQHADYSPAVNSFYARGSRPSAESFTVLLKALMSGAQHATQHSTVSNAKPPPGITPRSNNDVSERYGVEDHC
jgi:hypothetical protein